ncbi:MAG: GNAT family N-acetyltransferase [Lachnospiraceae bacterium]
MEQTQNKEVNAYCRKIRQDDLEMIMNWRMRPDITMYMNSDPVLTLEDQKKWFEKISKSTSDWFWILEVDGVPAGVASLIGYDGNLVHTGVYIAEQSKRSIKLALYIQWNLYRYSFEELKVNKVCEEVFEANKAVNRILDMCGSKREGVLRNQVLKNGTFYNVVYRGILKEEWEVISANRIYDRIDFEM